jgi:acetyl/propionyl-CoA carboxylase alpha subunit
MLLRYRLGDAIREVRLEPSGPGYRVSLDGRSFVVTVIRSEGPHLRMDLDGRTVEGIVVADGDRRLIKIGEADPVTLLQPGSRQAGGGPAGGTEGRLTAAMDGQVVAVMARPGGWVEAGTPLVVLEAMKMEMKLVAPFRGRVAAVSCAPGDVVERGRVLVEIDPESSPGPGS